MGDARTVVGIIGNVITFGLFICPSFTMHKIWKAKSVQEFSSDPYVVTVFNCSMWMLYGLPFVHKDNFLVLSINSIGLVLELIYVTFFLVYSDWPKRRNILKVLALEAIALVGVVLITLLALHGERYRSLFIGIACVLVNVAMYASPLTIIRKVIKTKSVEYMPFGLTFFNLGNGAIWLTYALLRFDLFIVIPNSLGMISGLFQLGLYACYYKRKPDFGNEGKPPKEVQLPVSQV